MTSSCNYCGKSVCTDHRLPENHNCVALAHANTLGPEFRDESEDSGIISRVSGILGYDERKNGEEDEPESSLHCKRCGTELDRRGKLCNDCKREKDEKQRRTGTTEVTSTSTTHETVDVDAIKRKVSSQRGGDDSPDLNPDGSLAHSEKSSDQEDNNSFMPGRVRSFGALTIGFLLLLLGKIWALRGVIAVLFVFVVVGMMFTSAGFGDVVNHPAAHAVDDKLESTGGAVESSVVSVMNSSEAERTKSVAQGADETVGKDTASPTTSGGLGSTLSGSASDLDRGRIERLIHEYVNGERVERGIDRLEYNGELVLVAREHGRDMYQQGYFAHVSPKGKTVKDRYDTAGIRCSPAGENIVQTWAFTNVMTDGGTAVYDTEEEVARGVVNQWMNSTGHRKNILHESYSEQGIGIVLVNEGNRIKIYATQNFC